MIFSFSVTTPTIGYSGDSEWLLDTGATYHVCPNSDWFSNFEKLYGYSVVMSDDRPCNMKGKVRFISRCLMGWCGN